MEEPVYSDHCVKCWSQYGGYMRHMCICDTYMMLMLTSRQLYIDRPKEPSVDTS